jgi:hypothetical protein
MPDGNKWTSLLAGRFTHEQPYICLILSSNTTPIPNLCPINGLISAPKHDENDWIWPKFVKPLGPRPSLPLLRCRKRTQLMPNCGVFLILVSYLYVLIFIQLTLSEFHIYISPFECSYNSNCVVVRTVHKKSICLKCLIHFVLVLMLNLKIIIKGL